MSDTHTSRPETNGESRTAKGDHAYFSLWLTGLEKFYEERDRRYEDRFAGQEKAVASALAAQKELTATAFAASEKAVQKAETAQSDYNIRSNEFRGQLDDQAKTLMPRTEALSMFISASERLEEMKKRYDSEIAGLRESRSETGGRAMMGREDRAQSNWSIGAAIAATGIAIGAIEFVLRQIK